MQFFFTVQGSVVPDCSAGVTLVFRCSATITGGVPLFRRCSVFCCSVFRCSWFYSMPLKTIFAWLAKMTIQTVLSYLNRIVHLNTVNRIVRN